ncbi:hypothetical protein TNIN_49591 [Trichonephila inaurata madagascariensis]|uniref:Uncharacterized protein n=1 Tax=Trichonephila inaurata madagascariensis TaxID=2747483 RepID=A0A8X6YX08_9ARAC|nr:hypothetical protein TNIN_49591 [Trichonephila inaurata madagascariensis]
MPLELSRSDRVALAAFYQTIEDLIELNNQETLTLREILGLTQPWAVTEVEDGPRSIEGVTRLAIEQANEERPVPLWKKLWNLSLSLMCCCKKN